MKISTDEDSLVLSAVILALAGMGYSLELDGVSIWNHGAHRLYEFYILLRNDETIDLERFEQRLTDLRRDLPAKPALYEMNEYPVPNLKNFSKVYLTVYI